MSTTTKTLDLGNNESASRGVFPGSDAGPLRVLSVVAAPAREGSV